MRQIVTVRKAPFLYGFIRIFVQEILKERNMSTLACPLLAFLLAANFFSCNSKKQTDSTPVVSDPGIVLLSEKTLPVPEPSALAYNAKTKTLYTVSDQNGIIYEMSLAGEIIREIPVTSSDLEGIAFSANFDTIYVAEERTYQIVAYSLTGVKYDSWKNVTSSDTKNGYEGVTVNAAGNFVVLNEKLPMLLLEADKQGNEIKRNELAYTNDISDICFDAAENCYWIVSDESKKILKLKPDYTLINSWSVNVAQAEGIAVTTDEIYVVSDSDQKLLIYKKPK
ncbi:MAG: SdiA-regulated domain-containing protein [Ignavibacteriales bacterium]|nr:SdiA-regulated domain-containing protein [Ignavibacteriales bacterium]